MSVFAVRLLLNRGLIFFSLWLALGFSASVYAGPWISPGDSALRSDILVLSDAGVISAPVSTWPLSWGDIAASLEESTDDLSPHELAAWARLRRRADAAMVTDQGAFSGYASLAENPRQIRTFEDGPREDAEIGIGFAWTGDWFALDLQGQWVSDPLDGDEWRVDGSNVGVALGNWMLAVGAMDRWWGPGWQGSLIWGNNARPIPAISLGRNSTQAFQTKWLSWIGPWDLELDWGFLEEEREIPNAQVFGMRWNFRPFSSLEVGLSRTALWCGDGQPCGLDTFIDVLAGSGTVNAFDHMGGYDIRWSGAVFGTPVALYAQWIGEDGEWLPSDFLGQFGAETSGHWDALGSYRFYLEWSDTECDFRFRRSIRNDSGPGSPGCAYTNSLYRTGQHYKGKSFAHSFDGDASVFTLGGMLTDNSDYSWLATFAIGNINRRSARPNTVADNKTRYREVALSHRRTIWIGELLAGVGFDYRKNTVTGIKDEDIRVYVEWGLSY
ncbi:MAG: capsule assembly Wzi family protein [Gammaproteobacteria bacterium]|nr:capsule assembly Wzi family protein [Gammaproteobacteria bacterium]